MVLPPATFLWFPLIRALRMRRRGSCGRSACCYCVTRTRSRRGARGRERDRCLSTTAIICVFAGAVVAAAVSLIPAHDLLVLRRVGAEGVAHTIRSGLEGGKVGGLAEAGPDCLISAGGAAARLSGLVEQST